MFLLFVRFFVFFFAVLLSLAWLSIFISDLVTPNMKIDEKTNEVKAYPRESRFWYALIAILLWAIIFAFL